MRTLLTLLTLTAVLVAAPAPPSTSDKIAGLIKQLGSSDARDREAAAKALEEIGAPAVEPLRKASFTKDTDFAKRATALAEKIRLLTDTSALFGPTMIEVDIKDMPIPEAVAILAKASGIPLKAQDLDKIKDRKVTLPSGKIAFWTAVDELCKQGKVTLVDGISIRNTGFKNLVPGAGPAIQPALPIVRPLPAPRVVPKGGVEKDPPKEEKPADDKPKEVKKDEPPKEEKKEDKKEDPKPVPPAPKVAPKIAPKIAIPPALQPKNGPAPLETGKEVVIVDQTNNLPTAVVGPFMIRGVSESYLTAAQKRQFQLGLQIFAEPKIPRFTVGEIHSVKIVDDEGQNREITPRKLPVGGRDTGVRAISSSRPYAPPVAVYPIALDAAPKEAKSLKVFSGILPIQVQTTPRELVGITDLGNKKSATSALGIKLELKEYTKNADGTFTIQADLTYTASIVPDMSRDGDLFAPPIGGPGPGAVRTVLNTSGLRLADRDGNLFAPTQMQTQTQQTTLAPLVSVLTGGGLLGDEQAKKMIVTHMNVSVTYAQPAGKELTPANLFFKGSQTKALEVPFELKNLPLK